MLRYLAIIALAAMAGAATAQPAGQVLRPGVTTVCLDVDGSTLPVVCHGDASRTDLRENICLCPSGHRVDAPVCGPGEHVLPEDTATRRARRDASQDGSLLGDTYHGAPFCEDRSSRG